MKILQFIFLLFLAFCLSYGKPHTCVHKDLDIEFGFADTGDSSNGGRVLSERENMRITFDFSSVEQFTGDMIPLRDEVKRQTELAGQFLSRSLKVNRVQQNLKFPESLISCAGFRVPLSDQQVGIPESDLHIYVDVFNSSTSGILAQAGPCILNKSDSRPLFGIFAINLHYFSKEDVGNPKEFEDNFETIAHELTHILGFTRSLYHYFINPETGSAYGLKYRPIEVEVIRGIETWWLTTPKVKELAREYFGCPTAKGMQLENQGGSGSAHSHWERTVLQNDYMTASAIGADAVFSKFTFALLEDSGWYTPTYEYVDEIDWGKGQGCEFLYECDSKKFREFDGKGTQCNYYRSSVASYVLSGKFEDNCKIPREYSHKDCTFARNSSADDELTGNYYSERSRCFDSNVVDNRLGRTYFTPQRCMQFKCNADATQIEVTVAGEPYTIEKQYNKILVEPKGANKYIQGYVNGPEDWSGFCNTYPIPCLNYCSSHGYCMGKTCHCHKDRGGKDCSVHCSDNRSIYKGNCLPSKECPQGTKLHIPTKECFGEGDIATVICPAGKFLQDLDICKDCAKNCTKCSSATVCTECVQRYEIYALNSENTVCRKQGTTICEQGSYLDKNLNECFSCNKLNKCKTCSNEDTCDSCEKGLFFNQEKQVCQKCSAGCVECDNFKQCHQCTSDYIMLILPAYQEIKESRYCVTFCLQYPDLYKIVEGICYPKSYKGV